MQKVFNALRENVEQENHLTKAPPVYELELLISQFNAYSLWLWHIIVIQTGIRTVNDAPGLIYQFDLIRNIAWISDKEINTSQNLGRQIPISPFLNEAIKSYLEYLKKFADIYNPYVLLNPNLDFFPIQKILASEIPFLLFSNNNKFIPLYREMMDGASVVVK